MTFERREDYYTVSMYADVAYVGSIVDLFFTWPCIIKSNDKNLHGCFIKIYHIWQRLWTYHPYHRTRDREYDVVFTGLLSVCDYNNMVLERLPYVWRSGDVIHQSSNSTRSCTFHWGARHAWIEQHRSALCLSTVIGRDVKYLDCGHDIPLVCPHY